MSEIIPTKFITDDGVRAIRRGVKSGVHDHAPIERKPPWLRVRLREQGQRLHVEDSIRAGGLHTVCEEALCPNLHECWSAGTATIMILGDVCTRACGFCAVHTGNPGGRVNPDEPKETGQAIARMKLRYVVVTSVDRDDLPDGGARHFADTIRAINLASNTTAVEVLTGDFAGRLSDVQTVLAASPDVFAHNIETVERLQRRVRDNRAGYTQSLAVLGEAARGGVAAKTSVMLGLGETEEEVLQAMDDARSAGVRFLTLGQYMRPTRRHLPVERWVPPAEFDELAKHAKEKGFDFVASGPLVRSSYRADRAIHSLPRFQGTTGVLAT